MPQAIHESVAFNSRNRKVAIHCVFSVKDNTLMLSGCKGDFGCKVSLFFLQNKSNLNFAIQVALVPVVGVEPTRYCYLRILSPTRLPIPPYRHIIAPDKSGTVCILT